MHAVASRVDNRRSHKNQQILFMTAGGLAPKQASDKRQITEDRNLALNFANGFSNHAPKYHSLPVPHIAGRHHFTNPKMRQRKDRLDRWGLNSAASSGERFRHECPRTVITDEFQNRGYQHHLNGKTVCGNGRHHVENRSKTIGSRVICISRNGNTSAGRHR